MRVIAVNCSMKLARVLSTSARIPPFAPEGDDNSNGGGRPSRAAQSRSSRCIARDGEEAARTRRGGDHQGFSTSINPCPIRDVTRPGADPTLECHGEPSAGPAPQRSRRRSRRVPPGHRMRPTRRGRPRGRPGRADARRPIPDPFEHGEFAYAETSPWPHFDHEYCLDNSHDHEVRGVLRQRPRPELPR